MRKNEYTKCTNPGVSRVPSVGGRGVDFFGMVCYALATSSARLTGMHLDNLVFGDPDIPTEGMGTIPLQRCILFA